MIENHDREENVFLKNLSRHTILSVGIEKRCKEPFDILALVFMEHVLNEYRTHLYSTSHNGFPSMFQRFFETSLSETFPNLLEGERASRAVSVIRRLYKPKENFEIVDDINKLTIFCRVMVECCEKEFVL